MKKRRNSDGCQAVISVAETKTSSSVVLGAAALMAASALSLVSVSAHAQPGTAGQYGDDSEYHEVVRGDTLWDLSGRYFGDQYEWPRLWSYNTQITNPHWIYPGDIVYLRERQQPDATAEAQPAVAQQQQNENGETETTPLGSEESVGLYLPLGGMLVTEEQTPVGRIIGSPKSARMLAEHDEVWIGFGEQAYREDERDDLHDDDIADIEDPDPVEEGDRYAIIRLDGPVEDQEGDKLGYKYFVVGSLEVTEIPPRDETAKTAMIQESWRAVERGDLLVPYERQLQLIQPREAEADLVARIVDSLDPGFTFAPQEYVFVDRGAEDGVRSGNRFFVYQQWEGFEDPRDESAPEIPWQQVGQVMVIDVREQYSMAIITRSDRELFIGDRLEMYQGH